MSGTWAEQDLRTTSAWSVNSAVQSPLISNIIFWKGEKMKAKNKKIILVNAEARFHKYSTFIEWKLHGKKT